MRDILPFFISQTQIILKPALSAVGQDYAPRRPTRVRS